MDVIIYCLLSLVTGALIILGYEWFIKRKDQIQEKVVKYVYFAIALVVLTLFGVLIGALINSKGEELGSLADWVSAIGTIGAFIWGIAAITKQTNIQRALNVESKRPRFSFELTDNAPKGEIIMRPYIGLETTTDAIEERLNKDEGFLFRLYNISDNQIYSLKIILYYCYDANKVDCTKEDTKNKSKNAKSNKTKPNLKSWKNAYDFHGMFKGQSIVLIPTKFIANWEKIVIRFRSSANEIGYMSCESGKSAHYYFVKDKNTAISTTGDDKLISSNEQPIKGYDPKFVLLQASKHTYKLDRYISRENKKDTDTSESKNNTGNDKQ